jgi:hypothetical protein
MLFVIALMDCSRRRHPGSDARGAAQPRRWVDESHQRAAELRSPRPVYFAGPAEAGRDLPSAIDAFLPPEMSSSPTFIKSGYTFSMRRRSYRRTGVLQRLPAGAASSGYALVADPLTRRRHARFFGTNADGTIYEDSATYEPTMPETGAPGGAPIKYS